MKKSLISGEPFPWQEAMRFGFGILKLSPQAFWSLTPRELASAIKALSMPDRNPMGSLELLELMTRFPDEGAKDDYE